MPRITRWHNDAMLPGMATFLYISVLCAASAAWQFSNTGRQARTFRPWATVSTVAIIAVPSLLQKTLVPQMLGALQRDEFSGWLAEPYRLVTSLVVQDGGWPGTIWNLTALIWIGLMSEWAWGAARWVVIALGAGLGAQVWGWVVQPTGAGNSVMVFGLAASLLVRALPSRHRAAKIAGILGLVAACLLFAGGDIHGGAAFIGALLAALLLVLAPGMPADH